MRKVIFLVATLLLVALFVSGNRLAKTQQAQIFKITLPFGKAHNYNDTLVTRVIDGDTIQLESGERVRLIGIDTPEIHVSDKLHRDSQRSGQDARTIKAMGKKAHEFTKALIEGRRVSLEFDVEKYDIYDRLLAYVYLKDGTFVNAEIVKQGYASLMTFPPNVKYADVFLKFSQEAREQERGLWGDIGGTLPRP
jgi:micrococcal nuclease